MKSNVLWVPVCLILLAGLCFTSYTRKYTVSQTEATVETEAEPASYARLRDLDRQIEKNHENEKTATANSRRASAESERKLWQGEVDRMLEILKKQLPGEEWERLAADQNQWYITRGDQTAPMARKTAGSAMEDLDRQISLAEGTRERAYYLAKTYDEQLSMYEEALTEESGAEESGTEK